MGFDQRQFAGDLVSGGILGAGARAFSGMGGIPAAIINALMTYGVPNAAAAEQQRGEDEAREATEERFDESKGWLTRMMEYGHGQYEDLQDQIPGGFGRLGQQGQQGLGNLLTRMVGNQASNLSLGQRDLGTFRGEAMGTLGNLLERNTGAYGDYQAGVLGELEGLGDQSRSDINRRYDELAGQQGQDLIARGMRGTSIAPTMRAGLERERSGDLGRLDEQIRRERLGTRERLGLGGFLVGQQGRGAMADMSNQLGAMGFDMSQMSRQQVQDMIGRFGAAGIDMGQQAGREQLGATERLGLGSLAYQTGLSQNMVNLLASRNDIPPNPNAYAQMMMGMGGASAGLPSAPNLGESLIGPGIGAAGSIIGGKLAAMVCVDGDAMVETPTGEKTLAEVRVGQRVRGTDGEFHRVTDKDYGEPHVERRGDYLKVTTERGSLVLTYDHPLDGTPAGEYAAGDILNGETVVSVEPHAPVASGDLTLAGCEGYVVNGFPVSSISQAQAIPA